MVRSADPKRGRRGRQLQPQEAYHTYNQKVGVAASQNLAIQREMVVELQNYSRDSEGELTAAAMK